MKIGGFKGALLPTLMIVSIMALVILLLSPSPVHAASTTHAPILIVGNDNFTVANGVTSGSGTENDPYIIENRDIDISGTGIEIKDTDAYFIVRNIHVYGSIGISLDNVKNGKIDNVRAGANWMCINLQSSSNNSVVNSIFNGNSTYGINSNLSDNNLIENNLIENNFEGIWLDYSQSSILRRNIFLNNTESFGVQGWDLSHFYHDIDTSNFIDGKPIYYIVGGKHLTFDGSVTEVGYLGLIACENIQVRNLGMSNNWQGILLAWTSDSEISDSVFLHNNSGIYLFNSSNNTISNNTVENNSDGIAFCGGSSNNLIANNFIRNNSGGVSFYDSSNNVIASNFIGNNQYGIELIHSSYNSIFNNIVENNKTIGNSASGIYLILSSDGNSIYHNNLINNREMQAYDDGSNYWDNGYPSGGNYWNDYHGADNYNGENQGIPENDGIGDTPYSIPGDNNQDRYPLMKPFVPETTLPEEAPTRWPLIIGIIIVVAAIGVTAVLYVRRMRLKKVRKRVRRKRRGRPRK